MEKGNGCKDVLKSWILKQKGSACFPVVAYGKLWDLVLTIYFNFHKTFSWGYVRFFKKDCAMKSKRAVFSVEVKFKINKILE